MAYLHLISLTTKLIYYSPKILAQQLNISVQMVNRYKRRGMPCSSLADAQAWRKKNIDPFRSKSGRIDGNTGKRYGSGKILSDAPSADPITETLTSTVPRLWFGQIGWLGGALKDHGVKVTAEQLIKIQAILFLTYMDEVNDFLKTETESSFTIPETLSARPGDPIYFSLVERLNEVLSSEPLRLYEA